MGASDQKVVLKTCDGKGRRRHLRPDQRHSSKSPTSLRKKRVMFRQGKPPTPCASTEMLLKRRWLSQKTEIWCRLKSWWRSPSKIGGNVLKDLQQLFICCSSNTQRWSWWPRYNFYCWLALQHYVLWCAVKRSALWIWYMNFARGWELAGVGSRVDACSIKSCTVLKQSFSFYQCKA